MINNLGIRRITGFLHTSFKTILHKYKYSLDLGDIVAGSVFSNELHGYLVDIGDNNAAFLPKSELSITNNRIINFKIIQEFFILSHDRKLSQLILSIKRLEYLRAWKRIQQLKTEDAIMYAPVIEKNSGGLLINLNGINGFLPNSHIINMAFKNSMIKTIIPLKFLFVDEKSNKLVLSHRRAILSMSKFTIGDIVNTKIMQIRDYGLFVQAHNILALLHISEIPIKMSNNLRINFQVNEYLKIMIIHIDEKQARVSVSIKKLFIQTNLRLQL